MTKVNIFRSKLQLQEQSFAVKGDSASMSDCRAKSNNLWELVKLILEKEKVIFGPSMVGGRDGGSLALRKQLSACKVIFFCISFTVMDF